MSNLLALTAFHVALSILAIIVGLPATIALFHRNRVRWAIRPFLFLAVTTNATGFLFPFKGVTPAIITSFVALAVLGLVLLARDRGGSRPVWRSIEAVGVVISLYLLVFVGIVQAFLKLPALHHLAPTATEAPFAATQLCVLAFFILLGIAAALTAAKSASKEGQPNAGAKRRFTLRHLPVN